MPKVIPDFEYHIGELAFAMSNTYRGVLVALKRSKRKRDKRLSRFNFDHFSIVPYIQQPLNGPYMDLEGRVIAPRGRLIPKEYPNNLFYLGFSVNLRFCDSNLESVDKRNFFSYLLKEKMGDFAVKGLESGLMVSPINGVEDTEYAVHVPEGLERGQAIRAITDFASFYADGRKGPFSFSSSIREQSNRTPAQRISALWAAAVTMPYS